MICWFKIKKMFNRRRFKWVDILICIEYIYIINIYIYLYTYVRSVIIMLFLSYVCFDIIYYDCHTRGLGCQKILRRKGFLALFIDCCALCPFHILRTKHQFNTFPIELFYDGAAAADVLTNDLFEK